MIKRNGVELMNERTKNVSIAKETIEIIREKQYTSLSGNVIDLSKEIDYAVDNTHYYDGNIQIDSVPDQAPIQPTIEIANETTAQAAVRLLASGKTNLVALNFASAKNQGGGFLGGASAQEEDLCRASALYSCLKRKPLFYNANIMCSDSFYTHGILYSPEVPFFRDNYNFLLEKPFNLSIISAPAPNLNGVKTDSLDNLIVDLLRERALRLLQVANIKGHKNIILGAWGCGAFCNDPEMVASVFKDMLNVMPYFEHVAFAVYDAKTPPIIFETFKKTFVK